MALFHKEQKRVKGSEHCALERPYLLTLYDSKNTVINAGRGIAGVMQRNP
jgi:hypothetical protein